jgi:HD superfamily phosphohydrolase
MDTSQREIVSLVVDDLADEDKTLRDPVHGDIFLNHLEVPVVDTEEFQRLRRIRQLGTAHLVFPGAEHSRFVHSLGALHMAQTILRNIRDNRFSQYGHIRRDKISYFGSNKLQDTVFFLVIRLAALFHDLHEFPLSHTLEKEGNILGKQWEDPEINRFVIGEGKESGLFQMVQDTILRLALGESEKKTAQESSPTKITAYMSNDQLKGLARALTATLITLAYTLLIESPEDVLKGRKNEMGEIAYAIQKDPRETIVKLYGDEKLYLQEVFDDRFQLAASQIVSNTISADLLDYAERDFFMSGIDKRYDKRFLKYAVVTDYQSSTGRHPVFAYRLVSKRNEFKQSVLSSVFDLLELRYDVAEIVHTHHTKNSFSAMAIEAFNFHLQSLDEAEQSKLKMLMMRMGDDELIAYLREKNEASKRILNYYLRRVPYEELPIWPSWKSMPETMAGKNGGLRTHVWAPKERLMLEKSIVKAMNRILPEEQRLKDGDCLVYSMPDPEHLYKELHSYILYSDENGQEIVDEMFSITGSKALFPNLPTTKSMTIDRIVRQRESLLEKYGNLWRTSLFLSPQVRSDAYTYGQLAALVQELFKKLRLPTQVWSAGSLDPRIYEVLSVIPTEAGRILSFATLYEAL